MKNPPSSINMETLLQNEGLCHIVTNVIRFLDKKSIANCRQVSRSFKNLIDYDRTWIGLQLEHICYEKKKFINCWDEFVTTTINEKFESFVQSIQPFIAKGIKPDLHYLVKEMWIYFKNDSQNISHSPLHEAIAVSNVSLVKILMHAGVDMEMPSVFLLQSPLQIACRWGNVEMVKLLINNMPYSNYQMTDLKENSCFESVFHYAAKNQSTQVLELMIATYGFEDLANDFGDHIIHTAVLYGTKETIEYLFNSNLGINFERPGFFGETILHLACRRGDLTIFKNIFDFLKEINSQISFETLNDDGESVIKLALRHVRHQLMIPLMDHYQDENLHEFVDDTGGTMLHYACLYGNLDLVRHLVNNFRMKMAIDVIAENIRGNTPLHYASTNGPNGPRYMIDYRTSVLILDYLLTEFHSEISQGSFLNVDSESFVEIAIRNDLMIPLLDLHPFLINLWDFWERTLLHFACTYAKLDLVDHLVQDYNFHVDVNAEDYFGDTPLHIASYNGFFEVVEYMLHHAEETKLDVGKKNHKQQTPLDLAKPDSGIDMMLLFTTL